jgi:hypothetical protein
MTSYKPEITTDNETWSSNALRFPTEGEAQAWVDDLYRRWSSVKATRVTPSNDAPTHGYINERTVAL